jgi:hypothetical protein
LNHSQIITIFKYIKIYPSQSGTGCQEILSTIEHTALSSLAGTAGAAWVAGICWPGINNLDHLKLIKTFKTWQFHAISGIVGKIQMSILGGEGCRYCAPRHSLGPSHDISYIFIHDHTCASHIQPSQTIRNYQNHQKILHSQTITVIHSIPIYLNTTQYIAIYPTQGTKKNLSTLRCPLLLGHFQVLLELLVQPGLLAFAGQALTILII